MVIISGRLDGIERTGSRDDLPHWKSLLHIASLSLILLHHTGATQSKRDEEKCSSGSSTRLCPMADRLFHCYAIGKTGTGKSTLMERLIRSDLANREGFALFDPHGDRHAECRTAGAGS